MLSWSARRGWPAALGALLLAGWIAAACSPLDATSDSRTCRDVAGCDGYQSCCTGDACEYVSSAGGVVTSLPSACASADAGGPDAGSPEAASPWLPNDFVGTWRMSSGGGTSQCAGGQVVAQPVNTSEVDTIIQTGPDTIVWNEPGGCDAVPLQFSGSVASFSDPSFSCEVYLPNLGDSYPLTFTQLVMRLESPDAGAPVGGDGGAEPDGDSDDAGEGASADDAGPPSPLAIPSLLELDLADSVNVEGTICTESSRFFLERVQ
jgi:hypothetical protein